MFLFKVFLFVCITFPFVSTKHSWFEEKNSETSKLIEAKIPKNFIQNRDAVLKAVFEIKENGNWIKIEDFIDQDFPRINFENLKIGEIEPGAFKTLNGFNRLNLAKNKLKIIKNGIFNDINRIHTLDLRHNEISTIEEDAFDNMPDIDSIYLSGNKINKINGNWFKNSPKFTYLSLDDNEIRAIEADDFKNLKGKEESIHLYLPYNMINKIHPDAFKGISKLHLNLRENSLKELPDKLFEGIVVEDLDIGLNNIPCTPKEVFNSTKLYNRNPPMCT